MVESSARADGLEQPDHAVEGARAPAERPARRRRRARVAAQARLDRGPARSSVPAAVTPYAELHCHSHFSFLDGASLTRGAGRGGGAAGAARPGDHRPRRLLRRADAGRGGRPPYDLPTVFGAELSLGLSGPQNGVPDPEGSHLLVLARGVEGYHRLAAAMTDAHLRGDEKGRPVYDLEELAERGRGHWAGAHRLPQGRGPLGARRRAGPAAAAEALDRLTRAVRARPRGRRAARPRVPGDRRDQRRSSPGWPPIHGLAVVAAGNVHHATPQQHRLASAMAAVRARRSLADLDGWLDLSGVGAPAQRRGDGRARCRRYPGAVATQRGPRRRARLRPAQGLARAAQARASPRGTPPTRWLRELAERGLRRALRRRPARAEARERHRARAAGHRREGLRRLLRHRPRHRRLRPRARGSSARAGARRPARRSATPSASPRSTRSSTGCPSSGSSPRTATRSPTSTSTSTPTGARRSSSGSTTPTAAATPRRWPT